MKTSALKWTGILFTVLLSWGCANTGISTNYAFSTDSDVGLVVFGLRSPLANSVDLSLGRYNDDGTLQLGTTGGAIVVSGLATPDTSFYLIEARPASYVFKSATFSGGYNTYTVLCLADGTYKFEVERGKLLYVGDLEFQRFGGGGNIRFVGFSPDEAVSEFLADYPNVNVSPEQAELIETSFPQGRSLLGGKNVCGGYYQQPNEKSDG